MFASINAFAEAVEIDGIYYNLVTKAKQAEVTSNPNLYIGAIKIPGTVSYNNVTYSVTSIGKYAFINCYRLTDVYCYAENMPSTERIVFNNSDIRKATLHVPAASIEQYKTTEPWSNFGTIVAIDDTGTQAS